MTATALHDPDLISDPARRPAPGPLHPRFPAPAGWPHVRSTTDRAYCRCGAVWVQAMTCHPCQQPGHPAEGCVDGPGDAIEENGRVIHRYPDRGAGRWCACQHVATPGTDRAEVHVQMPGAGKVPDYLGKALADTARQMDAALRQRLDAPPAGTPPLGELLASRRPAVSGLGQRALLVEVCSRMSADVRRRALTPMIEGLYGLPPARG